MKWSRQMNNRHETEKQRFAQGCGFYKLCWIFIIGGVIGCLVETIWCRFALGYWMGRSSNAFFPISIVWGIGFALFSLILYKDKETSFWKLFIKGYLCGSALEFSCGWLCEKVLHMTFWSYTHLPLNIGGRISLVFSALWGTVAIIWGKWGYPAISWIIEKIPKKKGMILTWFLTGYLGITTVITGFGLIRMAQRHEEKPVSTICDQYLDHYLPDQVLKKVFPKMRFVE